MVVSAVENSYRVGPGDVLQITVTGEPDFTGNFTVREDGSIFYSYLKTVEVGSKTVGEITRDLTTILSKDFINSPSVNVVVKEYSSKKIKIFGAVRKPGSYILKGNTRLLDAISLAGGLTQDAGSNVLIVRPNKKAPDQSPLLADATVGVANKVAMSDVTQDNKNKQSPLEKIETKQKQKADGTPATKSKVHSSTQQPIVVNYTDIVSRGKLDKNILIEAGDVINVPTRDEIYVLGHVNKPGPVQYEDNLTILQAISVAGGPAPTASTKSTYIIRKTADGKSSKIKVRLDKVMNQKAENIGLRPNDVIVVPESFF